MKGDSNELDDNLLNKIDDRGDEETHQDSVYTVFPIPSRYITVTVVVRHSGEKGGEDGEPPEAERGGYFQHAGHAFPFFTGYDGHDVGDTFGDNLEVELD